MREFRIQSNEAGQRFDKYLRKLLSEAPGSFVYKMLRKKNITLNDKKADGSEQLAAGDTVKLFLSDETFDKFAGRDKISVRYESLKHLGQITASEHTCPVLYEDADVLIVNKPAGMLSQKAKRSDISANEYILHYLIEKGELNEEMMQTFQPSVCNRLDRNTSGILIAGKTLKGLQEMSAVLKKRTVQKYYLCLVKGEIRENASIRGWLQKDEKTNRVTIYKDTANVQDAQPIETEYRPIRTKGGYTELEVHLITGRSHQIRAHLASIGHPIIGDPKYGDRKVNAYFKKECEITSQMLHAYRIVFSDQREVVAPCGEEFSRVRRKLGF